MQPEDFVGHLLVVDYWADVYVSGTMYLSMIFQDLLGIIIGKSMDMLEHVSYTKIGQSTSGHFQFCS